MRTRFAVYESPLGPLTVVQGPHGVLLLCFGAYCASDLAARLPAGAALDESRTLPCFDELSRYFEGKPDQLATQVDLSCVSAFARDVLVELGRVPYGHTVSYAELARLSGRPGAARAVGGVMRKNPVPILIPCHRVLAHDGGIGGYTPGIDKKRYLLALEGVDLDNQQSLCLESTSALA